jgi:hypothetical protein
MSPKKAQKPPTKAMGALKFIFHLPSSVPLHTFRLRFPPVVLLLFPISLVFTSVADAYLLRSLHHPMKASDPLAYAIVTACPAAPGVYIPFLITFLGFVLFQLNLNSISVFLLSCYPLFDFATFSFLHVPSYAAAFLCGSVGFFAVWQSLSFNLGSCAWIFVNLFAQIFFAVCFLIRPEGIAWSGIAVLLFHTEVVRSIFSPVQLRSWKSALRVCFLASQQFVFLIPAVVFIFMVRGRFGATDALLRSSAFRDYRVEFAEGLESWAAYLLFAAGLVLIPTVHCEFRAALLAALLFIGAFAVLVMPYESRVDGTVGKLFTAKILLLHATAIVFGATRVRAGRVLLGLVALTLSSGWAVRARQPSA